LFTHFFDRVSGMSRKFREWQPDASWLFPPSPRDGLPEGHLVYCLLDVTPQIDISRSLTTTRAKTVARAASLGLVTFVAC